MNILSMIGLKPKDATAAELRAAEARARDALTTATARVAELERRLGAVLIDEPEHAARHEADLAAARAEVARLGAILSALPMRVAEAEAREHDAELDGLAEAAEADAVKAAAIVPEIVAAAAQLGDLVARHDQLAVRVRDANRTLAAAGRARVEPGLARAWPHDPAGERPALLAPVLKLPGPRGPANTVTEWRAAVARATGNG